MNAQEIISHLQEEILNTYKDGTYVINHHEVILTTFFRLFGESRITPPLIDELNKVAYQEPQYLKSEIIERLALFLPGMLESNFYHDSESTRHLSPQDIRINTFLGFWTIASAFNIDVNLIPEAVELQNKFAHLLKQSKPYKLDMSYQDLSQANLSYVELFDADFSHSNLRGAYFNYAKIINSVFLNANLEDARLIHSDFSNSYLSFTNLRKAQCMDAVLNKSNLHGANLDIADMSRASLLEVNLDNSFCTNADFMLADLQNSSMIQTDMSQTNLSKANLGACVIEDATFEKSQLYQSNFRDTVIKNTNFNVLSAEKAIFAGAKINDLLRQDLINMGAILQ